MGGKELNWCPVNPGWKTTQLLKLIVGNVATQSRGHGTRSLRHFDDAAGEPVHGFAEAVFEFD